MKHLFFLLPHSFIAVISAAPTLPQQGSAAISSVLNAATHRGDVPGVAVAVVNKDGVLYNEAFGKSCMLTSTPMAKDTIFNMASMTKPATSIAIMMLVDEGKLKIDAEVAKSYRSGGPARHQQVQRGPRQLRDSPGEAADHHPPSAHAHSGIGYGFSSPTLTKIMARRRRPS